MTEINELSLNEIEAEFNIDLVAMLTHPEKLNQRNTNLCGVFTACKIVIDRKPELLKDYAQKSFADFMQYQGENAQLWKRKTNLSWSEFIVSVSMRKKLNLILAYNPIKDNGIQGFTWPWDINRIMKKFNLAVESKYATNFDSCFAQINHALTQQKSIVALFDWRFFTKGKRSVNEWHYIQINELLLDNNQQVEVNYWNPNGGCFESKSIHKKQLQKSLYMWWSCG